MKIAVKTRESKRENDYDWEDYFPSNSDVITEATRFVRALEGSDVDCRFAAFIRPPTEIEPAVVVSVSTKRRDDVGGAGRGRPIRTIAFLRAETPEETGLLAAFFAECLRKPDGETLYDEDSPLAQAVESLYQTKGPDKFIKLCQGLPKLRLNGAPFRKQWGIPRDSLEDRKKVADALPALIEGGSTFLLALTDRRPSVVRDSLGFCRGVVRIFSKAVDRPEKLPEPASQKYVWAAAIGGAVILALLVAAIGSCSRGCGKGEAARTTSAVVRADGGGANAPTDGRGGGTNAPSNRLAPVGPASVATNNVPTKAETMTRTSPATK